MNHQLKELCGSVTKIDRNLVVSISGELEDGSIRELIFKVLDKVTDWQISGAVIDFSSVQIVDSYMYKSFVDASRALKLLGVQVVWTGLNPMVVATLTDLHVFDDMSHIQTAINLEYGMDLLSAASL